MRTTKTKTRTVKKPKSRPKKILKPKNPKSRNFSKIKNSKSRNFSKLWGSQANQWINCSKSTDYKGGSNFLQDRSVPDLGEAIHQYGEFELTGNKKNISDRSKILYRSEKEEIDRQVSFWIKRLRDDVLFHKGKLYVEKKFTIKIGKFELVVKIDALLVCKYDVYIYDLKTGWIEVPADSDQMKVYAAIVSRHYLKNVYGVIVQPPLESVVSEPLNEFNLDFLKELSIFKNKTKKFKVGLHCKWCNANDICPELKKKKKEFMTPEFANKLYDRSKDWGEILDVATPILKTIEQIKKSSTEAAKIGVLPKGYEFAQMKVRRGWVPNLTPEIIAKELKIKKVDVQKIGIQTPKQIEKLLKTEKQRDNFKTLISKPSANHLKKITDSKSLDMFGL